MKKKLVIGFLLAQLPLLHAVPVWGQSMNMDIIKEQQIDNENDSQDLLELINNDSDPESVVLKTADSGATQLKSIYIHRDYHFSTGWLKANTNVRAYDGFSDDNILTVLPKYSQVEYEYYNDKWCFIKYGDTVAYVHRDLISDHEITSNIYYAPYNRIKSYMPYTAITSRSSAQWKLQQVAYTGRHGIRQVNDRYCIAVGSAYTSKIGQYIDLVLENGSVIHCILADQKADKDTNAENTITEHDGSLVEFVVSGGDLSSSVRKMGDISYAQDNWNSMITQVIVYDEEADY